MTDFGTPRLLLVFLWPQLALASGTGWPISGLNVGSEHYHVASEDWTGFYDWLRNATGGVVGVRYWPFEDTEFILDVADGLPYAKVSPKRFVEIYFVPNQESAVVPERSADQDFLYNPVLKSRSDNYVIGFATSGLTDAELDSIAGVEANWLPI